MISSLILTLIADTFDNDDQLITILSFVRMNEVFSFMQKETNIIKYIYVYTQNAIKSMMWLLFNLKRMKFFFFSCSNDSIQVQQNRSYVQVYIYIYIHAHI